MHNRKRMAFVPAQWSLGKSLVPLQGIMADRDWAGCSHVTSQHPGHVKDRSTPVPVPQVAALLHTGLLRLDVLPLRISLPAWNLCQSQVYPSLLAEAQFQHRFPSHTVLQHSAVPTVLNFCQLSLQSLAFRTKLLESKGWLLFTRVSPAVAVLNPPSPDSG